LNLIGAIMPHGIHSGKAQPRADLRKRFPLSGMIAIFSNTAREDGWSDLSCMTA
jgi:hypothetical protein